MTKCILEKKEESLLQEGEKYKINHKDKLAIEKNWEILNQRRKGLFNGTLLRFLNMQQSREELYFQVVPDVCYKDLVGLRSKDVQIEEKEIFQVLSCYIFIETSDQKTFFIERDAGDWDKALDMVGGFIQEKHNIVNVEEFVKRRINEDLGLGQESIDKINFLGTHDAKNILELMLLYKVNLNITLAELQQIAKVPVFETGGRYLLPIHPPLQDVLNNSVYT